MSEENDSTEVIDPISYILPILYKKDKADRLRMWKTYCTSKAITYQTHGLVGDFKLVTTSRKVEIMNVGKKNETTKMEQAMREIERDWTRQISKGMYADKKDKKGVEMMEKIKRILDASGGNASDAWKKIRLEKDEKIIRKKVKKSSGADKYQVEKIEKVYLPMHANKFDEKPKTLFHMGLTDKKGKSGKEDNWCYAQPKFDGSRCIARLQRKDIDDFDEDDPKYYNDPDNYDIVLTTRNGKQWAHMKSLKGEIKSFLLSLDTEDRYAVLDGELYCHVLFDKKGKQFSSEEKFQNLSKICRTNRTEPSPLEDQLCFYVFDIVDLKKNQTERTEYLEYIFGEYAEANEGEESKRIIHCQSEIVDSIEEIKEKQQKYIRDGYEGIILRAKDCMYQLKHKSLKLRKYKDFQDEEYVIIDATCGKGTEEGLVIWICENDDGEKFNVRPRGTFEERAKLYKNKKKYIGKLLEVRYQEKSKDNIPRFPVSIGIRDNE